MFWFWVTAGTSGCLPFPFSGVYYFPVRRRELKMEEENDILEEEDFLDETGPVRIKLEGFDGFAVLMPMRNK